MLLSYCFPANDNKLPPWMLGSSWKGFFFFRLISRKTYCFFCGRMEFSDQGPVLAQSQTPTRTAGPLKRRHVERLLIPTHHLQVCFNWVLMLKKAFVWYAQCLSHIDVSFFFLCPISSKTAPLSINNYSHESNGVLVCFHWGGGGSRRPCVVSLHHIISLNRLSLLPHHNSSPSYISTSRTFWTANSALATTRGIDEAPPPQILLRTLNFQLG